MEISSQILPGLAFSEHAPIVASLSAGMGTRRPSRHRLNTSHLLVPDFQERIKNLWTEREAGAAVGGLDPEHLFESCLAGVRSINWCWGKRRALERRARVSQLQGILRRAQRALEEDQGYTKDVSKT